MNKYKLTKDQFMRRLSARARIVKTVSCPTCNAEIGTVCHGANHDRKSVHVMRIHAYASYMKLVLA